MKDSKIKLFTEVLAVIAIVLISFVGIYKQKYNRMENQVKEYQYSIDLDGYREVLLEVTNEDSSSENNEENIENNSDTQEKNEETESSEENKENEDSKKDSSKNNYEKYLIAKKIIQKRIESLGVQDYTISQNTDNGSIYLQIPENNETDYILSNLLQIGKFEIKDSEDDSRVFVNNDNIKKVSTHYQNSNDGMTTVLLRIKFDKEGKKTLKEISTGEYKTSSNSTSSDSEQTEKSTVQNAVEAEVKTDNSNNVEADTSSEDNADKDEKNDNQKKVKLTINEGEILTSSFDDPIENGEIDLTISKPTNDKEDINEKLRSASIMSSILNSGTMPLEYDIKQNAYVQTDINQNQINKVYILLGIVFAVALIVLILKYNAKGIIAVVANIGFLALYLLVIRYTNVIVSLESIFTGAIVVAINYLLINDFLKMQDNTRLIDIFKSQIMKLIPIIIVAIVFSFMKITKLSTCGMFLFWGILVSFIYNYILTRDMIIRKEVNINEK